MIRSACPFILVALGLSGCATLSKEECLVVDWREVGFSDASRGHTQARVAEHRSACAEAKVTVNLDQYNSGFAQGLKNYCTANTGFNLGAKGAGYPSQCIENTFPKVRFGYQEGQAVHSVQRERNEVERELKDNREQSKVLAEQIAENRSREGNKALSSRERNRAANAASALQRTAGDIFEETRWLEERARILDSQINQLRASFYQR